MDDQEFLELITRFQAGQCSIEEQRIVERWLNSLESGEEKFENWSLGRKQLLEDRMHKQIMAKLSPPKQISVPFNWAKIAASILVLLMGCLFIYKIGFDLGNDHHTDLARKVILPDGTIVWLKGNSEIEYPKQFGSQRLVRLNGEALFEVAKDSLHPFILTCDSLIATVVGTSFNVKSEPTLHRVGIVVFTGKVVLTDFFGAQKTVLTHNDQAFFESNTRAIIKSTVKDYQPYLEGTQYDMKFEDIPLKDVKQRLEDKFDVQILLNDEGGDCTLSADMTDQPLQVALELITESLGGKVIMRKEYIKLEIPACR